jgi:tellurite resistance protein TerC
VEQNWIRWGAFGVVIAAALAADLFFFRRGTEAVKGKVALAETCGWIGLALAFGVWVYISRGPQAGAEFFTAYALEKSLSADNILVFVLIFRAFGIAPRYQHRILYTGILGALVMRLAFVLAGVQILDHFHFALYVFGLALVLLGVHMLISPGPFQPEQNWLIRIVHRIHPVDSAYRGERFWVRSGDHLAVTPVLLALVAIEAMDIIFALDSVPAVLAITRDVFVAYSSNVFAILGLRAMYFGLADLMSRMRFLHQGLAVILLLVGAKMLSSEWVVIPTFLSLAVILGAWVVTALAAWLLPNKR